MARLFPDSDKSRVVFASAAESFFYQQCRLTLGADWRVYHSCTLSVVEGDDGLKDNEMDFVCYHPSYGVVVVEVKGGRIRHDGGTGAFYSVNRHGESFAIKDPFQQALLFKSRLLRFLKKHGVRVPVSHAVCFPTAGEEDFPASASIAPELIIGRNRVKHLETALAEVAKVSQPEQYLAFADVAQDLDRLLIGTTYATRLYLGDYIAGHELRVKDVQSIHESLVTPITSAMRLGIEGEAGTGKTMLAVMLAKHFRDQGKSVLLITSNALLNLLIKPDLGAGIDIDTYTGVAGRFAVNLLIAPSDFTGAKEDWVQYEAPERLKKAIAASETRYQVVIADEAQDVQPFWWEAFESLLKSGSDGGDGDGRFYVFFDSSQGVFGAGGDHKFVASEVLPISAPYFPLVHNYRTTREIATFARAFRTSHTVLQSHCGRLGYVPQLITYKDAQDAREKLGKLVRTLGELEGLTYDQITLLSARNPGAKESILYQTDDVAGVALHRLGAGSKKTWKEARPPVDKLSISTIAAFKGLETPVGILINLSEYNLPAEHPIMASLIYVACTRARHMLYVMVREDDPKRKAFEAALQGIKTNGSLVLEGSSADFEFSGKVSHWNPDRVGWITVDDPGFRQGSVMFFPHDVARADIGALKVGTKLKFRPRVEGFVTIATDLMLASS
jgi:hypothetical protein